MSTENTGEAVNEKPDKPEGDEPLGEPGKKALIAERDARKAAEKSAADLQAQLDAVNAANMSDLEKAQKAAQDAQQAAVEAQREALRYRYAAKHGITDEDAELFLTGDTETKIAAQASALAERTANQVTGTPKPDLTQGGTGKPAPTSTGEQFAQFLESQLSA